jgi:hypothetical protein
LFCFVLLGTLQSLRIINHMFTSMPIIIKAHRYIFFS